MHGIPRATIDLDSIDNLNLGANDFVCFADRVILIRNRVVWARAGDIILSYLCSMYGSAEREGVGCLTRILLHARLWQSTLSYLTPVTVKFQKIIQTLLGNFFFLFNLKKPVFPTTLNPVSNLVVDISGLYSKHTTVKSGNSSIETLAEAQSRAALTSLLSP